MTDQRSVPRMVRLATLWQRKLVQNKTYFSGSIRDVQLVMFRGEEIARDNGEVVQTWKLLLQERNPDRRPEQRREPTTASTSNGARGPERAPPSGRAADQELGL